MFGLRSARRKRLRNKSFPTEWLGIIKANVPYYRLLPEEDRRELRENILVFIAEKRFEGCGGLKITDEIKVTVAAQACILLLHRKSSYYPRLHSILVYPHPYVAKGMRRDASGVVHEGPEVRGGESWRQGALVLAWDHVKKGAVDIHDGHNVVLHEFAHQLDQEDGIANGAPPLPRSSLYVAWARILGGEYEELLSDLEHHRKNVIDAYGATNPAEFFAVVTECFFEKPAQLKRKHPELYEELRLFYQQDPAQLQ